MREFRGASDSCVHRHRTPANCHTQPGSARGTPSDATDEVGYAIRVAGTARRRDARRERRICANLSDKRATRSWRCGCMIAPRGRKTGFLDRYGTTQRWRRPAQKLAQRTTRRRPARQLAPHRLAVRRVRGLREHSIAARDRQATVHAQARVAAISVARDRAVPRRAPSPDRSGAPAPVG